MAKAAEARQEPAGDAKAPPAPATIPLKRLVHAGHVLGEVMNITLEGDERIEEGVQDVKRWQIVGPRLTMNQWLIVSNDCGSMWRLMRVEKVHATAGTGLRFLSLRDIVPPKFIDVANEPIVSTGDWYVRYGGPHRQWMVIAPNGNVRVDRINTEAEAKRIAHSESGNPAPI